MAAGPGLFSAFSSSRLRSALRSASQAPVAIGAAVVAGAVIAIVTIGFDGGDPSATPERVEVVPSDDRSTTDVPDASSGPEGGSADSGRGDSPDDPPDPDPAPDDADAPAITSPLPTPPPAPTPGTDDSTDTEADGGVTRTGGAAPSACAGSVLLTLIDFRDGTGIDPVTDTSAPGIVTVSNATGCDPAVTVSRVETSGSYLLQNVPLGPQTITVSGGADVWAYEPLTIDVEVSAVDRVAVTQNILPRPRTLTLPAGTIRMDGPAAASRDVTLEVIDASGTNVGAIGGTTITLSGDSTNAEFDLIDVVPDRDLRIRAVGSSAAGYETVASASFELPPGTEPFELPLLAGSSPRLSLVATTTVTGTILGISADTTRVMAIDGATVTFPGEPPVVTAVDGSFALTIRSAVYGDPAGLAAIEVTALGYEPRLFLPAPGRSLSAVEEVLRPAGAAMFDLYPDLTDLGDAGDVGLDPSTRQVTIDASLLGGTGATRTFRFELRDGTVAEQPVRAADGTVRSTISTSPGTPRAGDDAATEFDLGEVPVGTYTLVAVPDTGDHIEMRGVTVEAGGASVTGSGPAFTLVVPPGDGAITLSADVQALTTLTVTVTGEQDVADEDGSITRVSGPLAGATVTVPAAGGLAEARGTTEVDGTVTLVVASGTYTAGEPSEIAVTKDGYEPGVVTTTTLVDPNESVTVTLELKPAAP